MDWGLLDHLLRKGFLTRACDAEVKGRGAVFALLNISGQTLSQKKEDRRNHVKKNFEWPFKKEKQTLQMRAPIWRERLDGGRDITQKRDVPRHVSSSEGERSGPQLRHQGDFYMWEPKGHNLKRDGRIRAGEPDWGERSRRNRSPRTLRYPALPQQKAARIVLCVLQ